MNDADTPRENDFLKVLRAQRGAAAAVAQYVHEISDRHAGAHRGAEGEAPGGLRLGADLDQPEPPVEPDSPNQ